MKSFILIICLFFLTALQAQRDIYLNEQGDTISKSQFKKRLRNKEDQATVWKSKKKNNLDVYTVSMNKYLKSRLNYTGILLHLERITGKRINPTQPICIEYTYKDDLCSSTSTNKWTRNKIITRKQFQNPIQRDLKSKKITLICLFEEGITLKNKPEKKGEYFYQDSKNFFKKLIFKKPTLCGSFALIKPNGETLIRNGEYRADYMAAHLKSEIWDDIFKK